MLIIKDFHHWPAFCAIDQDQPHTLDSVSVVNYDWVEAGTKQDKMSVVPLQHLREYQ